MTDEASAPAPTDLEKLTWLASDEGPLALFSPASRAAIARAVAELERLRAAIREHRDQRGDDRCWIDDHVLYAALGEEIPRDATALPPKADFLASCERYYEQRRCPLDAYPPGRMRLAELEAEVGRLEAERDAVTRLHILRWRSGDDHPVVRLPWRKGGYPGGEYGTVERCYHFGDDASAIEAIRAAAGLAPPDRPRPDGGHS